MADISLANITMNYKGKAALNNVSLEVKDEEFFVVFGPAGAGKTTLLNVIAGIVLPSEGVVRMNGNVINAMEPEERNVAMVFENYALYPHLTVFDNMASPCAAPHTASRIASSGRRFGAWRVFCVSTGCWKGFRRSSRTVNSSGCR